jgi:predicted nucleotidyltransferase
LRTLGYFDLFHYPLNKVEICLFHAERVSIDIIESELELLESDKLIFRFDEFYTLQNDHSLIQRRKKGNQLAIEQMVTARKVAKLLSAFPFVKAVAVSGSLSKNFATEKTDIDFFIITDANRLWIARTCMHLYKKLTFLFGRQHWFCMNYYVDEAGLEIMEKNIFTATEIVTLRPMQGRNGLCDFVGSNEWTRNYFPSQQYTTANVPEIKPGFWRRSFEKIFSGSVGDVVDKLLMNITDRRWQKKARRKKLNAKGGSMGMAVGRHFSKPDPKNFQEKIMEQYRVKVQQLMQQYNKEVTVLR